MGRKKHKRGNKRKGKHGDGLQGVSQGFDIGKLGHAVKEGGLMLLTAIAAGGAGAALGKHSFLAGIPVTVAGRYFDNKYITAAGLGLSLSNGFQTEKKAAPTSGVNGFDFKQVAEDAKERVGKYFENFKEKLYIPATPAMPSATDGLGAPDKVQYFINPYGTQELDLSAMERVEQQIASMNKTGGTETNGFEDIDREF